MQDELNLNKALVLGSQVLAVIFIFAGSFLQRAQLNTARPPGTGGEEVKLSGAGDRYARLWEDPLRDYPMQSDRQVVDATAEEADPEPPSDGARPWTAMPEQSVAQMQGVMKSAEDEEGDRRPLVLWNVIDARPTPEARERRLRARYALITALAAEGYLPKLDSALRGFRLPLDWDPDGGSFERSKMRELGYYEPFERFVPANGEAGASDVLPKTVTLVWHPVQASGGYPGGAGEDGDFRRNYPIDTPGEVLAALRDSRPAISDSARVVILNHGSSNQLARYVNWMAEADADDPSADDRVRTVFTMATAPPGFVFESAPEDGASGLRGVVTDDKLIARLRSEICRRRPDLVRDGCRVVVFTESDGAYGRILAKLVEQEFSGLAGGKVEVKVFSYLRGLDGLESERAGGNGEDAAGPAATQAIDPYHSNLNERGWGTSQYDYLRRLAGRLESESHGEPGPEGGEFRGAKGPVVAVGVLGSDVYDKLLVLQAVRPQLSGPIYFTTDLESQYLQRANLPFTRNLLVAAGSGLDPEDTGGWRIPPMRDSYQTALVASVRDALHGKPQREPGDARVWEVGTGDFHLVPEGPEPMAGRWLLGLLGLPPVNLLVFTLAMGNALLLLAAMLCMGHTDPAADRKRGGSFVRIEALAAGLAGMALTALVFSSTLPNKGPLVLCCLVLAVVLGGFRIASLKRGDGGASPMSLWWLTAAAVGFALLGGLAVYSAGRRDLWGEPLELASGIGIWPSVLLRILAFLIGLLLLFFTARAFSRNGKGLREDFDSLAQVLPGRGRECMPCLERWDRLAGGVPWRWLGALLRPFGGPESCGTGATPDDPFGRCIECCFDRRRRFLRVAAASLFYLALSFVLFAIWTPVVPARGGLVFLVEKLSLSLGVGLYIVHLCFCVELHLCAHALIRRLTRRVAAGTPGTIELRKASRVIGDLTDLVGTTLLYPIAILSLLLLSRLRIFDDWTMTPSLVLTLLIGTAALVAVSVSIVSASRRFRLEVGLLAVRAREAEEPEPDRVPTANDLESEYRSLLESKTGGFAPWYRQPIFVALFGAIGVLGGVGMVDPVLDLFFG